MYREGADNGAGVGVETEPDGINEKSCCRDAKIRLCGIVLRDTTLIMMEA